MRSCGGGGEGGRVWRTRGAVGCTEQAVPELSSWHEAVVGGCWSRETRPRIGARPHLVLALSLSSTTLQAAYLGAHPLQ